METVKLSSKGQIVIPKSIRDEMHLQAGAEFVISMTATGLTLTPNTLFPLATDEEVCGILAKPRAAKQDDDELKARIKARLRTRLNDSKE